MNTPIRSARMRGDYHRQLQQLLSKAARDKVFTQESLGRALDRDQTTLSRYLGMKPEAAPLDLDDAHVALQHLGTSLAKWIANPATVEPKPPSIDEKTRLLLKDDFFIGLVEALHGAPPLRRHVALGLLLGVARELVTRQQSAPRGGPSEATGTSKKPKKRR